HTRSKRDWSSDVCSSDLEVLLFAQALNGLILPIIAILIMIVVNKKNFMGEYINPLWLNIVGWAVAAVVSFLGIYSLVDAVTAFQIGRASCRDGETVSVWE